MTASEYQESNLREMKEGQMRDVKSVDYLDRKICPGCGKENPVSQDRDMFTCGECCWQSEESPSIRGIMRRSFSNCDNVDLGAFLRTLFRRGK